MSQTARRERQITHARQDILQASARAFARLGFEGTTIQDIAKEAGYTPPSLYAYFKGKQQIIEDLIATMEADIVAAFDGDVPAGLSFAQRLELLFRRLAEVVDRWVEARSLLFELDRAGLVRRRKRGLEAGEDPVCHRFAAWLRTNARRSEDLGGKDPEEVAYVLRGMLKGIALLGARDGFRKSARNGLDLALDICLHGLGGAGSATGARRTP